MTKFKHPFEPFEPMDETFTYNENDIKLTSLHSNTRMPVIQYGECIGSFPAGFNPRFAKSRSFMYDIRSYDFKLENGKWIVHPSLGASDVDCIEGFIRNPDFGK